MFKMKDNTTHTPLAIHPGKKLEQLLKSRNIKQNELAARTGVSEKHISTVINGTKDISISFAKKLEYALGIDADTWINLQSLYDKEIHEAQEANNISEDEISILKPLKDLILYAQDQGILTSESNNVNLVLGLRSLLRVSNLTLIPGIPYYAAYRAQVSKNVKINVYVLYAWQCICEKLTEQIQIAEKIDKKLLLKKIPEIKNVMFEKGNMIPVKLEEIFSQCGIAFKVVKHFSGAPVQGFIKYSSNERLIMCVTIRQARSDIFWFSLFHEIGHVINDDIKNVFVDFSSVNGDKEGRADEFAGNCLIDLNDYKNFVMNDDFSLKAIEAFAETQGVKKDIVIGRLQHDEIIGPEVHTKQLTKYVWAS